MSDGSQSLADRPPFVEAPWMQTPNFDSTNSDLEPSEDQIAPMATPPTNSIPPSSVEETIRFAEAHYDRALRRLAD